MDLTDTLLTDYLLASFTLLWEDRRLVTYHALQTIIDRQIHARFLTVGLALNLSFLLFLRGAIVLVNYHFTLQLFDKNPGLLNFLEFSINCGLRKLKIKPLF